MDKDVWCEEYERLLEELGREPTPYEVDLAYAERTVVD